MKTNKIRIAVNLVMIVSLFLPYFARADFIDFDGASNASEALGQMLVEQESIFSAIENRYGFDRDTLLRAKRKVYAPRVEIFFDKTDPKPGEKITATATPEFFKNDPQNLYYTWYLVHTEDGTPQTATNSVGDGKEEAAGIIARGDYDPALDEQTHSDGSADPDKDGWPAVDANNYAKCEKNNKEEDRVDCNFAPMGGADGVGGLNEELREKFDTAGEACRDKGNPDIASCNLFEDLADRPLARFATLTSSQTNFYCNQCLTCFDKTSPADCVDADAGVEDLPQGADLEERNQCCWNAIPLSELSCDDGMGGTVKCPFNSSTDYCGTAERSIFSTCYSNFRDDNRATITSCINKQFDDCKADWEEEHRSINEEDTTRVSRCFKHKFGVNFNPPAFREDDSSGLDTSTACEHKWPHAKDFTSGSGKFSTREEEFWSTDPRDPDTDGDGFPDEADVIGLGQDTFTWTYQAGDRVGVVVEGTSLIPTDEKNAYYKIMWGYLDVCDATKKDLAKNDQCEEASDEGFGYLATKSPSEEIAEEKIKASLSYSPENPVADPTSDETIAEADQIEVLASIDSTELNPANLYYSWYVQKEDASSKTGWSNKLDITQNFSGATPAAGLGAASFGFTPKKEFLAGISSEVVNIKVTLAVSRTSEASILEKNALGRKTPRKGYASVEIPINKNGVRIALHKVNVIGGVAKIGEEICTEGLYKMLCPAVEGQMLAAVASGTKYNAQNSEFSWNLDDEALNPPADYAKLFPEWSATSVFFPIMEEAGKLESISATVTPKDKLQTVAGVRAITVVTPAAFIKSADENVSWQAIYSVENPSTKYAAQDLVSEDTFWAYPGKEAAYFLDFVPYYLLGGDLTYTSVDWKLNGASVLYDNVSAENPDVGKITLEPDQRTLKFTTSAIVGSSYSLDAEVQKYWSEEEKNILFSAWGAEPETLAGETSATVTTVAPEDVEELDTLSGARQMLAAIGTHLPGNIMYLLRLVLTLIVMIFASAVFYGLSQRISLNENK